MAFNVFISYSTLDMAVEDTIKKKLDGLGVVVFVAEYSVTPGEILTKKILEEIRICDVFILLWSNNSKSSEWVPQEIGIARGAEKFIIPIMLESNVTPPAFISDLKYLEIHSNPTVALLQLQTMIAERLSQHQNKNILRIILVLTMVLILLNQD